MRYPALDVTGTQSEFLLALADDFAPSAVEEHGATITLFFSTHADRDRAQEAIGRAWPTAVTSSRSVDDEDWARRSQQNLSPIVVGRITVTPPWSPRPPDTGPPYSPSDAMVIVVTPSMGFGTGHHATTRLCLAALQTLPLAGRTALDVGTGSGVLAMAARLLGASEAVGIDHDGDAIQAATDNLEDNRGMDHVRFLRGDLREAPLPPADVVTANLTGALLVASAALLLAAVRPGGTLIVSGLLGHERDEVARAFAGARLVWEASEDGWAALAFSRGATIEV